MQKNTGYKTKIEHPFLLIPVKIKENAERLSFYIEEQKVLEYRVFPLEEGKQWIIMLRFRLHRG